MAEVKKSKTDVTARSKNKGKPKCKFCGKDVEVVLVVRGGKKKFERVCCRG